jgi:hypothetical protein
VIKNPSPFEEESDINLKILKDKQNLGQKVDRGKILCILSLYLTKIYLFYNVLYYQVL